MLNAYKKIEMKYILFFMLNINMFIALGETKTISGKVLDANNTPFEYAVVALFVNDSILQATQTDTSGVYSISFNHLSDSYKLMVSSWGTKIYEEDIPYFESLNLTKDIKLNETSALALGEVVVKGRQNTFTLRSDRYIYTPDITLLTSSTAFDILKQTPMVKASDDEISLIFKSGTNVYLNNQPLRMPMNSLIDYLKSMPSDNIKNIEVITNPGSQYEASTTGGIINIVLKRNIDDGFNGQIMLSDEQARKNRQVGSASFRFRKSQFGLEGGVTAINYPYNNKNVSEITTRNDENQKMASYSKDKTSAINFNLNAEYAFNHRHIINLYSTTRLNRPTSIINSYTEYSNTRIPDKIDSVIITYNRNKDNKINNNFFNITYQFNINDKGQTLNTSADYMNYYNLKNSYTQFQLEEKPLELRSGHMISVPQKIKTYSVKVDYNLPIFGNNIALGVLYSRNETNNDDKWSDWNGDEYVFNPIRSNLFLYTEDIGAIYSTFNIQRYNKVNASFGLRAEYTSTKGNLHGEQTEMWNNDYLSLFPSMALNYMFDDMWRINYSLTSKLQRPAFWELNPMRYYTNENLYHENNPFLKSVRLFSQESSVSFNNKYILSAQYTNRKGDIARMLVPDGDIEGVNRYGRFNYGDRSMLFLSLMTSFVFFNGTWTGNISAGPQYDYFKMKDPKVKKYYNNQSSWNAIFRASNKFILSETHNLSGYFDFRYYSPNIYLSQKNISYPVYNVELRKIWTNWTLSLLGNDIFNTGKVITKMVSQPSSPYKEDGYTYYPDSRSVRIRLSYRFGNLQTKGANSKIANDEVRQRVN